MCLMDMEIVQRKRNNFTKTLLWGMYGSMTAIASTRRKRRPGRPARKNVVCAVNYKLDERLVRRLKARAKAINTSQTAVLHNLLNATLPDLPPDAR